LERALNLRSKILSLEDNKKESEIEKCIKAITQIGNAIALARCIRTALMDYNSQNGKLLTNDNINDYNQLAQQISLQVEDIDPNDADNNNNSSNISSNLLNNIQNSLNECNKTFCETINNLKQIGKNTVNYLEVLVSSFGDSVSCTKIPEIELFSFLIPPITFSYIDNAINARENLMKKNKTEESSYFSNDGFMVGICYLLKIFSCDKKFESLNWFPSVLNTYKNKQNSKQKNNKSSAGLDTLNERQTADYKEQFEILYFTYTSATILFTE
jgi:WASH complex subunit 7